MRRRASRQAPSAVGPDEALIADLRAVLGDRVRVDLAKRQVNVLIADEELARRKASLPPAEFANCSI